MVKFTVDKNKENPYVMLNKTPLSDNRISWRAKGIWAYLLSKPDNWTVREKDLINKSTEGRDAVRAAIKELVENGYIIKNELREKGKFVGVDYSVFETPINTDPEPSPEKPSTVEKFLSAQPLPGKPSTEKPLPENPPHSNNDVTNKPINNKTTTEPVVNVVAPILNIDGDKLPKGIKSALITKLSSVHGSEAVQKQLKNLRATLTTQKIKNPAGWLTVAVGEGFDSKTEVDLFAVQENKELEEELVEKLNANSMAVSELADQDFKAMLGQRPQWFLNMLAGAGV